MKVRGELILFVAIVLPFLVLIFLGLDTLGDNRPAELSEPEQPQLVKAPQPQPERAPNASLRTSPPVSRDAGAGGLPDVPEELRAPLAAVEPEVIRCFVDQRSHLHDEQRLAVSFRPLPDGGFAEIKVPTGGNPYLAACVEDVFQEMSFLPSGRETFREATHTFVFDPTRP